MNDLIKIENREGQLVVSSRQIAEHFEKEHKNVLQSIQNLMAENSAVKNMVFETTYVSERGKTYPEYLMNRDGFSLLVMGFTGTKALEWKLKYIAAFNEMERTLKERLPAVPKTLPEALRLAADLAEKTDRQAKQLEEQRPKVLFANAVETSETSILIGDLAKLLKQNGHEMGQKRLFEWLRNNGYLIKHGLSRNMPTQRAMEMKLFEIRERTVSNPDGSIRITRTPKVTGKGQTYFINKMLG